MIRQLYYHCADIGECGGSGNIKCTDMGERGCERLCMCVGVLGMKGVYKYKNQR